MTTQCMRRARSLVVLLSMGCAGVLGCAAPASSTVPSAAPVEPPRIDAGVVASVEDPYLWLEDVGGERALAWVRERNAVTERELSTAAGFTALRDRLKGIYDSKERIPFPAVLGKHLYNFWKDEAHPRGLWRRTSLAEFKKPAPRWEPVLDLDALSAAEKENWVWHGATCLYPKYERCLVRLSRGGADADVVREFDTVKKAFLRGGFELPEAKTTVGWRDLDTIYVGTDFGPGSLTDSGYPRIVKAWRRGTPLTEASTLFEGQRTDIAVSAFRQFDHGVARDWVTRSPSFFTEEDFLLEGGALQRLDKPADASASVWDGQLLLTLRTDWTVGGRTWPAGALLAAPLKDYRAGKRDFAMLFEPKANTSLSNFVGTRSALFVVELEDVKSRLFVHTRAKGQWKREQVDAPAVGSFDVTPYDEDQSDEYWFTESGYTTPVTLALGALGRRQREPLKRAPAFFSATGLDVTQHFATSKDGTKVPYFQVSRQGLALDGSAPTVLDGYGGFEVSLTPGYDPTAGAAWLERGGVYVEANIRGGGEYGPRWHDQAIKQNRQRAYDDFIAVAEDLIARKVTSTPKLGIIGGSNGGLLMGVMLTQRPDLFGAIVCEVPLLDMKRYHLLLAGASWMEEYGDPDQPEEWAALAKFSPYQNVKDGVRYPRTLFTTSTRDDRVHPGHARKMVARLLEKQQDLLYYENIEGGHGGAANNEQAAFMSSLAYTFFARQLGLGP